MKAVLAVGIIATGLSASASAVWVGSGWYSPGVWRDFQIGAKIGTFAVGAPITQAGRTMASNWTAPLSFRSTTLCNLGTEVQGPIRNAVVVGGAANQSLTPACPWPQSQSYGGMYIWN
jgi:hypothetical protein